MDAMPPWPVVKGMLLAVVLPGLAGGAGVLLAVCAVTRSETARMMGSRRGAGGGIGRGKFCPGSSALVEH